MRRRQIAEAIQKAKVPRRPIDLSVAIELALKGGYCPACGIRKSRDAVREHFKQCGGAPR